MRRSNRGGEWLDAKLDAVLAERGVAVLPRYCCPNGKGAPALAFPGTAASYRDFFRREIVRDLKETATATARVPVDKDAWEAAAAPAGTAGAFELPDGTLVDLGTDAFRLAGLVVDDDREEGAGHVDDGAAHAPLPALVHQALAAADVDVRKELAGNVLLAGGASLATGLSGRLGRDLATLLPSTHKPRVVTPERIERQFGAWIGGSVLASLGSFQQLWLTRDEYRNWGAEKAAAERFEA